jgi:opacity protein-like surface antigen
MKTKSARIAAVLACLIAAPPAAAAELGFYVGGQVGQASKEVSREFYELFNDDIQSFSGFTPVEDQTSLDDSDTAFAIVAGYRLTRYLAFEGSFAELGQVTYKSRATGNFPLDSGTLNTNIESETSGFGLAVIGTLPLTRDWEVFARGGVLFATQKIRLVVDATGQQFIPTPGDFDVSGTDNTDETFAAVGISRRFFEIYDVRLEYLRVFNSGAESTGGKGDLDAALLGLNVTF